MILKKITSFILILTLSVAFQSFDCDSEEFVDDCAAQIAGYKFLKANKVSLSSGGRGGSRSRSSKGGGAEVMIKQVFSKGTIYKITACSGSDKSLHVSLMDRSGRKQLISNYSKKKNKYYPSITYSCKATGVYYLNYKFEDNEPEGCEISIIGFTK